MRARKALVVLAALGVVATACGTQEPVAGVPAEASLLTTAATTTTPPTTPPSTVDPGLPAAPWSVPALPAEAAPSILRQEWGSTETSGFCSALYPANANDLAADAVVRAADFGSDAWALAWDRPEGPGRSEDGQYCTDCGRSAFGVAGLGELSPAESVSAWPTRLSWSDGSTAGYGLEGLTSSTPGAPHLSYLSIAGQGCTYNMWSFLGEDHLLQLIEELRFVEGMLAVVIDDAPDAVVRALGAAPWLRSPVGDAAAPAPLLDEWIEEVVIQETCPLLSPVSLGEAAAGAEARRASREGEMLAAWDLPRGPGRYSSGEYCSDCGRGAVGIGTIRLDLDAAADYERFAVTYTWDDGSTLRVISESSELFNVPPDRAEFTDPQTGEPAVAPHNAYLTIPGLGCSYRLWSFLGADHAVGVVQSLRPVLGFGETIFSDGACPSGGPSGDFEGDGIEEHFEPAAPGGPDRPASVLMCPSDGSPPVQVFVTGPGELFGVADVDGDGDVEILSGGTSVTAGFYEIYTDGAGGTPTPIVAGPDRLPLTVAEGTAAEDGFLWGCRDDGTIVQLEASLRGGSLEWVRTAYRIEGLTAVNVGSGSGATPVESIDLADALFEDAVTELVGTRRCGA